ncbi:MAG: hypothetical protein WC449_06285, partial [Candidatus Paceibacterota bacterium]
MPDNILKQLIDLCHEITIMEPIEYTHHNESLCIFCGNRRGKMDAVKHKDSCPFLAAQRIEA